GGGARRRGQVVAAGGNGAFGDGRALLGGGGLLGSRVGTAGRGAHGTRRGRRSRGRRFLSRFRPRTRDRCRRPGLLVSHQDLACCGNTEATTPPEDGHSNVASKRVNSRTPPASRG